MKRLLSALLLAVLAAPSAPAASAGPGGAAARAESSSKLPAAALLEPAALARRLGDVKKPRPVLLQVGFVELYKIGHIPGSVYAGPASRPEGLAKLRERVKGLSRDRELVVYCGCCPFVHCPNVEPAYAALKALGFKRVRVLELKRSFGQDWSGAGLPTVKGAA